MARDSLGTMLRKRAVAAVGSSAGQAVPAVLLAGHLRRVFARTAFERDGTAELGREAARGPVICVYWHGRIMSLACTWETGWGPASTVTSQAYPGRLAGQIFRRFGLGTIAMHDRRSNRAESLALAREIRGGRSVFLAADGPAGPRRVVKAAALDWARLTGAPVWLVALSLSRFRQLNTWDRMLMPRAGGRALVLARRWGEVPKGRAPAEAEALRARLEADLTALTDDADRRLGHRAPLG